MTPSGPLPLPDIEWRDGTPRATAFDDIYFNPEDGLAETRHVFLDGTGLPEAWQGRGNFVIGELGFGTGLNFLAARKLWREQRPTSGQLHFISIEAAPLNTHQLERTHAQFPQLAPLADELRQAYPPRARGHHVVHFCDRVSLHLLFGEAAMMLKGLQAKVDAWFLDGFAPSKNPDMWSEEIMRELARCSSPGARLATFTVAGDVRRALTTAGFQVEKAPGFASKREMLKAKFQGGQANDPAPWYAQLKPTSGPRIAIIGAGIAGLSAAVALNRRGFEPTIFEAGATPGSGGSGAPSGLVMPRLSAGADAPARFYAAAHRLAVAVYKAAGALSENGALHLPPQPDQWERLEKMAYTGLFDPARMELLTASEASRHAGVAIKSPALYFRDAGALEIQNFLEGVAKDLDIRCEQFVQSIQSVESAWQLRDAAGKEIFTADTVVVAAAMASAGLLSGAHLPLEVRHGQITALKGPSPHLPIAFGGYVVPRSGGAWVGATHTPGDPDDAALLDPHADGKNLAGLAEVMPALADGSEIAGSWAGTRAATPDFLPLAGPIAPAHRFLEDFAPLAKGQTRGLPDATYEPGLFIIAGLGSRGFVTGPLLGELIAAQICGTPLPIERDVSHALHPSRFLVRDLKRGTVQV